MAKLYPNIITDNKSKAETKVFNIFKTFSDDFHIIHSLPWLSLLTSKKIDRFTSEGEIDFVILNKNYGILCLEIKGGIISYKQHTYFTNGNRIKDPYVQVQDNQHYLRDMVNNIRIGYCVGFPDSEKPEFANDKSVITFDIHDLDNLENKIIMIFQYWKRVIKKRTPTENEMNDVIKRLLPESKDELHQKIVYDNKEWLTLSKEQISIINNAIKSERFFIGGRAGTGKTVLAIIMARALLEKGSKILFLTFNRLINEYIKRELYHKNIDTYTFHKFLDIHKNPDQDAVEDTFDILKSIVEEVDNHYDILIIDEAQSFGRVWLNSLSNYFLDKKIYIFADSLQSFSNEGKISDEEMNNIFHFNNNMTLTKNYRSPRKVYERLLEMFNSSIQQVSPRDRDRLDLIEKITDNPYKTRRSTIDNLLEKGLQASDIIILISSRERANKDLYAYRNIEVETIHRYRGMEKPIIIYVLSSASKNDLHELYIAYSRSTTQTIVIIPEEIMEVGRSELQEILMESDLTSESIKDAIDIARRKFEDIFRERYPEELRKFKIRYSDKVFLFRNKKYKFINTLFQKYLLSQNLCFIETSAVNESKAIIHTSSVEAFSAEINLCEGCGEKDFLKGKYCLECTDEFELKTIEKNRIWGDLDIMFNSKNYSEKENAKLNDSLKPIARLFLIFNKDKERKFTVETLDLLDHQDVMCISFTIEILILLLNYPNNGILTLEEIRNNKKIKQLNSLNKLSEAEWKSKTGIYINRFIKRNLFSVESKGKYIIHTDKIFKK